MAAVIPPAVLFSAARTEEVLARIAPITDAEGLLSGDERVRHEALVFEADRRAFLAARVLARWLLAMYDGHEVTAQTLRAPSIRQRCDACERPHGRPRIVGRPDLGLSWTHTREVVAAAVGPGPVGVDVEYADPLAAPPRATATVEPSGDPVARWLPWTRAEACVKAGLADLPAALTWPLDGPPQAAGRVLHLPSSVGLGPGSITLTDWVDAETGMVGSVASRGPTTMVGSALVGS